MALDQGDICPVWGEEGCTYLADSFLGLSVIKLNHKVTKYGDFMSHGESPQKSPPFTSMCCTELLNIRLGSIYTGATAHARACFRPFLCATFLCAGPPPSFHWAALCTRNRSRLGSHFVCVVDVLKIARFPNTHRSAPPF